MTESGSLIPADLLSIMQCPACEGTLHERPAPPALVCSACGRGYRVVDGIPIMLLSEAEPPNPGS